MGKMKLTKKNTGSATKGNSGIPNWLLSTIIGVVLVAVLISTAAGLITSSGIVGRLSNAMKSEDYKVDGNMMLYFYASTYNNFASQYGTYLNYLSLGEGTPVSEHHKIVIGGDEANPNKYDTSLFADYEGKTWFEYFMSQTQESVKSMLIYCEAADDLNVTLNEEDEKEINDAIDALLLQFKLTNGDFSDSTCLRLMYGDGIKKSDVRKAMKLSTLATKCAEKIYDEVEATVTDATIDKEYADNKLDYDIVDYFYYSFGVSYNDVVEEVLGKDDYTDKEVEEKKTEILEAYKKKIEETRALAEELKKLTDLAQFKNYIMNYDAKETYDQLLDDESLKSEDLPSEEDLKTIKEKLIAAVIAEVLENKEEAKDDVVTVKGEGDAADTYTIYDISIKKTFADSIKDIKEDLFTNISTLLDSYDVKKETYTKDDDVSEWAFAEGRKDGDIGVIESGDGTKEGEFKVEDKKFSAGVYFITKAQRRDEDKARDVAYMMFTSTDTAKKAIEKLKAVEGLDKDKFAKVATEVSATAQTVYEDYTEGSMQSSSFDAWLYDEKTVIGTYTATPITMSDGSSMVAMYVADGEVCWKLTVKDALIEEGFSARETAIITKYSSLVTANQSVIGRIGK